MGNVHAEISNSDICIFQNNLFNKKTFVNFKIPWPFDLELDFCKQNQFYIYDLNELFWIVDVGRW